MVYFKSEPMKFPNHFSTKSNKIKITNELTNEVEELDFVDESEDGRYYVIDLSNLELRNGTYKYSIGKDTGLLQVGDYVAPTTEYNEKKENKVYER